MKIRGNMLKAVLILALLGIGYLLGKCDLLTGSASARAFLSSNDIPAGMSFNTFGPNEFGSDNVRQIDDVSRKVICYAIKNAGGISCVKY